MFLADELAEVLGGSEVGQATWVDELRPLDAGTGDGRRPLRKLWQWRVRCFIEQYEKPRVEWIARAVVLVERLRDQVVKEDCEHNTDSCLVAERRAEERLLVGADFNDLGLVFHQPDGSWLHPDAVSSAFLRRVGQYELPRLTLHGLRHTWATLALERGIHPRVVQERLGHATIAITLDIYSHVSPTLNDEAARLVADLVMPSPTG